MRIKRHCTLQHDSSDCAAAVVSTILLNYNVEMSMMKIREIIGTDSQGTSVKGIVEGLKKLKFNVKAIGVEYTEIDENITFPLIAQVKTKEGLNHFVVIQKVKKKKYYIGDPAQGNIVLSEDEFSKIYLGLCVLMIPASEFEKLKIKDKGMYELFCALIFPQKKLLFTIILCSFVLSVIGIFFSTFLKVLMDEIIPYQLKRCQYYKIRHN